jgi:hypothetical protein
VQKRAAKAWDGVVKLGEVNGYRNAQASVLAPTGCLTADTLVSTDRGLTRLGELGDVWGERWQDLDAQVSTDEGPRQATKFFVNGEEPTRLITTEGGYTIQGTLGHRIKVVESETGSWVWKRMADLQPNDLVPIQLGTLVGEPRLVPLPVLDQAYYTGDRGAAVPDSVTPELAELVGFFMGAGSLQASGIRVRVANADLDVVERIRVLAKDLFHLEPTVTPTEGHHDVQLTSIRLARWWQAAGFSKVRPGTDHTGKAWSPRVPSAILETNDGEVYGGFLRGLFEADGVVADGVPSVTTASRDFAAESAWFGPGQSIVCAGDHYDLLRKQVHYTADVGHHRFVVQVKAPREQVFDLWTNLDRAHEWTEGLTRITDVTGPVTTVGTRYTVWFGRMRSPTEVLQVDRPKLVRTRFGSWLLRGVAQATFEDQGHGTRLTQEFWTNGIISAVMGRIFAFGSYKGSFRGELNSFVRLAEREAQSDP